MTRRLILIGGGASIAALACGDSESTAGTGDPTSTSGTNSTGQGGSSTTSTSSSMGGMSTTSTSTSMGGNMGTGGAGTGGSPGGSCAATAMLVVTGSNDDVDEHQLMIPMADLIAGVDQTYESTPNAVNGHTHEVTLTAADFTALQSGETVTKYSCRDPLNQSDHEWAISCADPNVMPVLSGEIGTVGNCPA